MTDYTLPSFRLMQKIGFNGNEYVPKGLSAVVINPPFTKNGDPISAVILPSVSFTEDYIITTDETATIKDNSGNVFEYLVGTRPKKHRP